MNLKEFRFHEERLVRALLRCSGSPIMHKTLGDIVCVELPAERLF